MSYPSPIPKFGQPQGWKARPIQLFGDRARSSGSMRCAYFSAILISTITRSGQQGGSMPVSMRVQDAFLSDEVIVDDAGGDFVCSDTDYCEGRAGGGHLGRLAGHWTGGLRMDPLCRSRATKRYGARKSACSDVSFDLYPGELIGDLWAESGSGKSTLLKLLRGILRRIPGRFLFDTRTRWPARSARHVRA